LLLILRPLNRVGSCHTPSDIVLCVWVRPWRRLRQGAACHLLMVVRHRWAGPNRGRSRRSRASAFETAGPGPTAIFEEGNDVNLAPRHGMGLGHAVTDILRVQERES